MSACTFSQLGAGGIGVGNDANACLNGVGLGANSINVTESYFTQVMANSITVGGIMEDAHHPSDPRMIISDITVSGNIFFNNSALFSSTVNIVATYLQYSTISNNDIHVAPYSGICYGYGWGANDAGGSDEYRDRGLYKYQPVYSDPTTLKNNLVNGNLVHSYGLSHTDLGAYYSLSRSPATLFSDNYGYDGEFFGIYTDEGSSNSTFVNNVLLSSGNWYASNDVNAKLHNQDKVLIDNWGKVGSTLDGFPNGTGRRGNTFIRNFIASSVNETSIKGQRTAYRAGILPRDRAGRLVSNQDDLADGGLTLQASSGGMLVVKITNFDDFALIYAVFQVSAENAVIEPVKVPETIPADSAALATYTVSGSETPKVSATVSYTNGRTGQNKILVREEDVDLSS